MLHLLKRPRIEAMLTMRPPEPPCKHLGDGHVSDGDGHIVYGGGHVGHGGGHVNMVVLFLATMALSYMKKSQPRPCSASALQC